MFRKSNRVAATVTATPHAIALFRISTDAGLFAETLNRKYAPESFDLYAVLPVEGEYGWAVIGTASLARFANEVAPF